jgi:hypothetical protein
MRQKLGSNLIENRNASPTCPVQKSEQDVAIETPPTKLPPSNPIIDPMPPQKRNLTEKKSRPPKMRLKKYLEVDTDIIHKRPREDQSEVSEADKRRKLEVGTQLEVETKTLHSCSYAF